MNMGLTRTRSLKKRAGDLFAQASAKLGELKDGISADKARSIESEHESLCREVERTKAELRDARHRDLREIGDRHACRRLIDEAINAGEDDERIRSRVLEALVDRQAKEGGPRGGRHNRGLEMNFNPNHETFDDPNFVRKSIEDMLYARMTGKQPEGAAREFIGRRLDDLDNILAEARGERRSWLDRRSGGFHTTSDFPSS